MLSRLRKKLGLNSSEFDNSSGYASSFMGDDPSELVPFADTGAAPWANLYETPTTSISRPLPQAQVDPRTGRSIPLAHQAPKRQDVGQVVKGSVAVEPPAQDGKVEASAIVMIGTDMENRAERVQNALSRMLRGKQPTSEQLRTVETELRRLRTGLTAMTTVAQFRITPVTKAPTVIRLDLLVGRALAKRVSEVRARGVEFNPQLAMLEVYADLVLTECLVDAAIEWCLECGNRLLITTQLRSWPKHGMLRLTVDTLSATESAANGNPVTDGWLTTQWRMVTELAANLGIECDKFSADGTVAIQFSFPQTVQQHEGMSTFEFETGSHTATTLKGSIAMVLVNDRMAKMLTDTVLRDAGMIARYADTGDRAMRMCEAEVPQILIIQKNLADDAVQRLIGELRRYDPTYPVIELVDEPNVFDISGFMPDSRSALSINSISKQLHSALVFELLRSS